MAKATVAPAHAGLYDARMASRILFNSELCSWRVLVACVVACGPSAASTDTSGGETSPASSGGTTSVAPTSSGGATGPTSGTEAGTSTAAGTTSTSTATGATSTGSSSTGSVPVGSTSLETSTGPAETTTVETSAAETGSSSTGADTGDPVPCQTPVDCEPIFFKDEQYDLTDIESGWVFCNGGTVIYRDEAVDCAHEVFWPKCEGQGGDCATDDDCPGSQVCANIWGDCGCVAQCMSDGDCQDGEICVCAGDHPDVGGDLYLQNTCMPANCASKSDCEGECGCRGSEFFCGHVIGAFCPTLADECSDSGDCPQDKYCAFDDAQARWTCQFLGICE